MPGRDEVQFKWQFYIGAKPSLITKFADPHHHYPNRIVMFEVRIPSSRVSGGQFCLRNADDLKVFSAQSFEKISNDCRGKKGKAAEHNGRIIELIRSIKW